MNIYMLYGDEVDFTYSNLPIIIINTNGESIPDEPKIPAYMSIIHNEDINYITDVPNHYDGSIGIEVRGHSSQSFPKKQYLLETRDSNGNVLNCSLFGMPDENDWVLYAPYSDKSLMRNVIAYNIARSLGFYAPRTQFCEVLLNDEYIGVYVFIEKIKKDNGRVNIEDPTNSNITGGYIVEVEAWSRLDSSDIYFFNNISNKPYVIHFPKEDDLTQEQLNYIESYMFDFDITLSNNGDYKELINLPSWIDFILLNEAFKNNDLFFSSTHLYKEQDNKLYAGPIWDFNIAFGNINYNENWSTDGWLVTGNFWTPRILQDISFYETYQLRWKTLRNKQLSDYSITTMIDSLLSELDEPQQRNFSKWPILGEYIWPNYFIGEDYFDEIEYLSTWIQSRFNWIDEQFINFEMKYPIINEINYHSSNNFNSEDWIEIHNPYEYGIDISEYIFKNENDNHEYIFPENLIIETMGYLVVCRDTSNFKEHYPNIQNYLGNFEFGLSNNGELIKLYDSEGILIDYVDYDDNAPWPIGPDGNGPTLELKDYPRDNYHYSNWEAFSGNGTPGEENNMVLSVNNDRLINTYYILHENYPNPFNPITTLRYNLPEDALVNINIYDMMGRQVRTLVNSQQTAGFKSVQWNAINDKGTPVSAGIYLYSIEAGQFRQTKKMVLLK